jgi:hypothetical protein
MLEVKKTNEGIVLSLSFQLDKEDAADLIKELQAYVDTPTFKGISEFDVNGPVSQALYNARIKKEAREQNESKKKLQEEMRRVFVDVLDDEYLETKFATVYKLDEINREVEILRKKLNKQ